MHQRDRISQVPPHAPQNNVALIVPPFEWIRGCDGQHLPYQPGPTRFRNGIRRIREMEQNLTEKAIRKPFLRDRFKEFSFPGLVACCTLIAVAVFTFRAVRAPVVSANEVIVRSIAAEQDRSAAHQRIRIRCGAETVTRDVWRNAGPRPLGSRGRPYEIGLSQRLVRAGWPARDPLSARSFGRWRNSLKSKRDSVRVGDRYLRVSTSTDEGEIANAELTVQRSDFHALAETIQLRNSEEIELEELGFDDNVGVPAAPRASAPLKLATPTARHKRVDAVRPLPTPVPDQDEVEANVRFLLHRLNDDLGLPIEVRHDNSSNVYIEALDVAPERIDQIRQALPQLRIETVAPAPAEVAQAPVQILHPSEGTSLGRVSILERRFPDPRDRTDFGNTILEESHAALLHAYAVRNLMQQYPIERWRRLGAEPQRQLTEIQKDHLNALKQLIGQLRGQLEPIVPRQDESLTLERSTSVDALLSAVQEVDLLPNVLFAGANTTLSADEALSRLGQARARANSAAGGRFIRVGSSGEQTAIKVCANDFGRLEAKWNPIARIRTPLLNLRVGRPNGRYRRDTGGAGWYSREPHTRHKPQ